MDELPYDALAGVYDWLQPEPLLTPAGSVEAFAGQIRRLPAGAAVLDCSAGTGALAVGLALEGFTVVASDVSTAMLEHTRRRAQQHGVDVEVVHCAWEELGLQGWDERFAGVFCVGNSLAHAPGRTARRAALAQMAGVLAPAGLLTVTSRNWELQRALARACASAPRCWSAAGGGASSRRPGRFPPTGTSRTSRTSSSRCSRTTAPSRRGASG